MKKYIVNYSHKTHADFSGILEIEAESENDAYRVVNEQLQPVIEATRIYKHVDINMTDVNITLEENDE